MGKIIMITGGQRSGKSEFAESLALDLSERPIYLATASIGDSEMEERVRIHQQRRGDRWLNLEEPLEISRFSDMIAGQTVLLDCLTMLLTNHFFEYGEDVSKALEKVSEEVDKIATTPGTTLIVVTNEIGLGGISADAMQRKFTDLQGKVNQFVASKAEEVYFVVSGIQVKIKG